MPVDVFSAKKIEGEVRLEACSTAILIVVSVVFLPRGLLGWLLRLPLPARLER